MEYTCDACGHDEVVEICTFGSHARTYYCVDCGSERVYRHDTTHSAYTASSPPSVGRMMHRQATVEADLAPSPMEQAINAARAAEITDDLVDLLDELKVG